MTLTMQKRCPRCRESWDFESFYMNRTEKDGRDGICINCRKAKERRYRQHNRQEIRQRQQFSRWRSWRPHLAHTTVVTSEAALRDALTRPEPFYAVGGGKG